MPGNHSGEFYEKMIKCNENSMNFEHGHQTHNMMIKYDCLDVRISDEEMYKMSQQTSPPQAKTILY